MKKFLLSMATGAMVVGALGAPVFAAEGDQSTGTTNIGYTDGAFTDPENPTNPAWSVSVPKDFIFTKDSTTHDMKVSLNEIRDGGLAKDKAVHVDVASANGYKLKNTANANIAELNYELKYGTNINKNGEIGILSQDTKEISGTATLENTQLSNVNVDGTYTDVLTYTIHKAVLK